MCVCVCVCVCVRGGGVNGDCFGIGFDNTVSVVFQQEMTIISVEA